MDTLPKWLTDSAQSGTGQAGAAEGTAEEAQDGEVPPPTKKRQDQKKAKGKGEGKGNGGGPPPLPDILKLLLQLTRKSNKVYVPIAAEAHHTRER